MQKTFATFILLVIASTQLGASPVEPLWQRILGELELEAQLKIPQHELVKYPHELLASYAQLPNFPHFTWLEIYQIYHSSCKMGPCYSFQFNSISLFVQGILHGNRLGPPF